MKKIYWAALIMITIAIVIIINASGDVSTYADFETATKTGERVKVTGVLAKDREMHYDPENAPNIFRFYMTDAKENTREVVLTKPKPQDFELSEQIVLTGRMKEDGRFHADEILMKCPSKYKNEEIYTQNQ
jgi:cytochrome c-type biogenesis protein CcmE